MAKSKLIKDIANGAVTLEVSLRRALIIANDLDNKTMISWVKHELSGYEKDDEIPEYRLFKGIYKISYNLYGTKHNDEPVSLSSLFGTNGEDMDLFVCRDSISSIEESIKNEKLRKLQLPNIKERFRRQIDSFYLEIPQSFYCNAIAKVSDYLLELLMQIEKEVGVLDSLDVCADEQKIISVNKIVNNYIGTLISVGDNNKIEKSNISSNSNKEE